MDLQQSHDLLVAILLRTSDVLLKNLSGFHREKQFLVLLHNCAWCSPAFGVRKGTNRLD